MKKEEEDRLGRVTNEEGMKVFKIIFILR